MRSTTSRAAAAAATVSMAGLLAAAPSMAAPTGAAPRAAAAVSPMTTTPAGQFTVMSANLRETLHAGDLNESRDIEHFAARVRAVLDALTTAAPDVVVTQETVKKSVASTGSYAGAAAALTARTGHQYKVAFMPTASLNGVVKKGTSSSAAVLSTTAMLYNADTVTLTKVSSVDSAVPKAQAEQSWRNLRQPVGLFTQKVGGKRFAVAGLHFSTAPNVKDHNKYAGIWANAIKKKLAQDHPKATAVIAGDFNRKGCYVPANKNKTGGGATPCTGAVGQQTAAHWAALSTASAAGPRAYRPLFSAKVNTVDNLWTSGAIVSGNRDYDYRKYNADKYKGDSTKYEKFRFDSAGTFDACMRFYDIKVIGTKVGGHGSSAAAAKIRGCSGRYYSDHDFIWATVK